MGFKVGGYKLESFRSNIHLLRNGKLNEIIKYPKPMKKHCLSTYFSTCWYSVPIPVLKLCLANHSMTMELLMLPSSKWIMNERSGPKMVNLTNENQQLPIKIVEIILVSFILA